MTPPAIVLTTDFGTADAYVGVMKGVILGINPSASIIDLSHDVAPQNILQAAFILGTSHKFFPDGSIHVVVVDPGVGTHRRPLLLVTPTAQLLAPDNGVLSHMIAEHLKTYPEKAGVVSLPEPLSAFHLNKSNYWLEPVSNTFHGRDVFAPVAAHLSLGVPPEEVGEPVEECSWLPSPRPSIQGDAIVGEVIYIDRFGNLVTNIPEDGMLATTNSVEVKGRKIHGLSRTFHDDSYQASDGLLALVGSHGYLEIAVKDGSAALTLAADVGEPVLFRSSTPRYPRY